MINYLSAREGRSASGMLLSAVRQAYPGMVGSRTWQPGADWFLALPIRDLPPQLARRAVAFVNSTFVDDAVAQTLRAAPVVIAHSPLIADWMRLNGFRAPDHVISCGYHPSVQLRSQLPGDFTVGLTGYEDGVATYGWQDASGAPLDGQSIKGVDHVAEIAELLEPGTVRWRLDRGTSRTSLAGLLRSRGHIVDVDGEPGAFLSSIDCLLITSRTEGGPPEALDALAAGVPVVSTLVGELPSLSDLLWRTPSEGAALLSQVRADREAWFARRHDLRARVAGRSRPECAEAIAGVLQKLPGDLAVVPVRRSRRVAVKASQPPRNRAVTAPPPSATSLATPAVSGSALATGSRPPVPAPASLPTLMAGLPQPTTEVSSRSAAAAARRRPAPRRITQYRSAPAEPPSRRPLVDAGGYRGLTTWGGQTQLVSVLMTAWRTPGFLAAAVDSVCSQRLPDGWGLELLIAVDGCVDSMAVARSLRDPRIVVVELAENGGTYRALNTLLPMARGSLIAIMDGDDVSLPGRFVAQIRALEADPDLAYVGGQIMRANVTLGDRTPFRTLPADPRAAYERGRFCFSAHGTLMMRRSLFETLGGYDDTRLGGDHDLVIRALAFGMKGTNLPVQMLVRRQHPSQLTAAPETGIGSRARKHYTNLVDQRWAAYRSGVAPPVMHPPARTPVASVHRPGFTGSSLVVMATIQARTAGARTTLLHLLGQGADRIVVYLNGHSSPAGFPEHDRIEYRIRPPGTGPAVRLDVDASAYETVFYVDDDIDFPDDYLAVTRSRLMEYGPSTAVSYHVRHWQAGAKSYAERTTVHFSDPLSAPISCGYAGLGVAAMPGHLTRLVTAPRPSMFDRNDDLWFSSVLGGAGVPIVRPPSVRGWLRPRPDIGGSLYTAARANRFQEREKALEYLRGALGWAPKPLSYLR
jgi:Glycosyl transferase family 2